jgi:drug/metabolite transporter (DMT)-like permease
MSLILIAAIGQFIVWVGLLLLSHYRVRAERRPGSRWIAAGGLLLASGFLLVQIASRRHWTFHHSAVGVAGLLLDLAALACIAMAFMSLLRRRAGRQKA